MKRELCILHIGTYKTGSSSLQEFLRKSLNSEKFKYVNSSDENHSRVLMSLVSESYEDYHGNRSSGLFAQDLSDFINNEISLMESDFLNVDSNSTMILSSEDLCTLSDAQVLLLKSYLHKFFYQNFY